MCDVLSRTSYLISHTLNEVMRLLSVCCLWATEVVLFGKLGENEVYLSSA
jgi:hypothetical protein